MDAAAAAGNIEAWGDDGLPERLLGSEPAPGGIVAEAALESLEATQLQLSNGMRVTYRKSNLMDDQILLAVRPVSTRICRGYVMLLCSSRRKGCRPRGTTSRRGLRQSISAMLWMQAFAVGGLSEVQPAAFSSARLAVQLAHEFGPFGFQPHILADMLAGKRVDIRPTESTFWRDIAGSTRPADLEVAMQLLHKLFTTEVWPPAAALAPAVAVVVAASIALVAAFCTRRVCYHWLACGPCQNQRGLDKFACVSTGGTVRAAAKQRARDARAVRPGAAA